MVVGLPKIDHPTQLCDSCMIVKQTRLLFPNRAVYRVDQPLQPMHTDLCGPIMPQTSAGNQYFMFLVDDFSRMMWIHVIKSKSDAFAVFKKFRALVENKSEHKLKALRTNQGGEFLSCQFAALCDEDGVARHLTAPYAPQ